MVRCYASRGAPSPGTLDGCADYKPPPPNLHSSLRPHILPLHDGDKLYDLLRDLWDLLDALRMEYWVTGATLLLDCAATAARSPGTLLLRWRWVRSTHLDWTRSSRK